MCAYKIVKKTGAFSQSAVMEANEHEYLAWTITALWSLLCSLLDSSIYSVPVKILVKKQDKNLHGNHERVQISFRLQMNNHVNNIYDITKRMS